MSNTRRAQAPAALAIALTLALVGAGCGGGGGSTGIQSMGMLGVPSPALFGVNLLFVDATLNGRAGGRMLADTGSPFTLVDPTAFTGLTLPAGPQVSVSIGFGEVTVSNVPALEVMVATMDKLNLGGIAGGNMLERFSATFDYRGSTFQLGAGHTPDGVEQPGGTARFSLAGGGRARVDATTIVSFPATRVPLTVDVEGTDHPFLLDTGASDVTLRGALFDAVTADGRARVGGFPVTTASGPATAEVTRLKTITVAGEAVTDVAAINIGDTLLDTITEEIGQPVDGLLGGGYLREFLVTVDYPHGTLLLQRYATRDHIVDEFKRVGISLGANATGARVVSVYAGSDAAQKGIMPGDVLLSVDNQALDPLDELASERALEGTVGTTKLLAFGTATSPSVNGQQIAVRVDDLVPAPGN
jgi:hypothetical protein